MYSQYGEDDVFLPLLSDNGRFLDIGAWDPITFSNTRALIERGWSGVMIEPSPGPLIELLRACSKCAVGADDRLHEGYGERKRRECLCGGVRYGFDPQLTIIPAAVGVETGLTRICVTDDALSTFDGPNRAKWDKVGGFYGYLSVPMLTPAQIVNQFGSFEFVSIDTEGTSIDVLRAYMETGARPYVVMVEHDGRIVEANGLMIPHNYRQEHCNDTNLIFAWKGDRK